MNGRRLQFGVAVIDNKLYVVGGRDGLKTSNMVECYNPVTKVWSTMPPMSTHRHGLGEWLAYNWWTAYCYFHLHSCIFSTIGTMSVFWNFLAFQCTYMERIMQENMPYFFFKWKAIGKKSLPYRTEQEAVKTALMLVKSDTVWKVDLG